MAVLKDLIVHGASRFLNGIYSDSMEANTIKADSGIFNQLIATTLEAKNAHIDELTANNATVFGVMDVKGKLQTNQWEAASIANVGGNFYISPTGKSTAGTVTITRTSTATSTVAAKYSVAMSGTFGVSSTSSTIWAAGAYGMATGNVAVGTKKYPLGTCDGPLSNITTGTNTITGFTISNVESAALDIIFDENSSLISSNAISSKPGTDLQVSVYLGKDGSNYMPIGILLTSYGKDSKQYIDIYDGTHSAGTSITGFAEPTVRIGDLSGLSPYSQSDGKYTITPSGWGIYTTQGYFRGEVYSEIGYIGGWTIDGTSIKTNNKASIADSTSGMRIDSANGIGFSGVTYFKTNGTGKIGPWNLTTTALYNGSTGINNTSSGVYLGYTSGNTGLNISGGSAATTITISNSNFTKTINGTLRNTLRVAIGSNFAMDSSGTIYANGANITDINAGNISAGNIAAARMQTNLITAIDAVISDLQAINATIGGFEIDSTSIHTNGVEVTSNADNSIALSSADFTRTINSTSREGLRFAIGDKFGVTGDGTIYASDAVISGAITASSGYIGTSTAGFTIGASSFYNGMTSLTDTTNNGVYIGTNGIALGAGAFKVTSSGALTTSNLKITNGNSYLAGNSTNNVNAFYWGTPTDFSVSYKGKYFINTSGNACFNSLYIGGHTVGDNWDEPPYYFTNAGNIKANSVTTNTISGTPVISGFYLHSNKDRGVYVTSDGYVSVYNNANRVQLSAGSGSNTYRVYAYCSSFYVNSTLVSSSDKKIKNHISYLADDKKIEDFIMSLKPAAYVLKDGQSGRKHLGFYAQDVRDGAKKTIGDAAIYLASTLDMDDFENYSDDIPDEEISWGLRYDEFIAPMVALIQKQNREIKDLQKRIAYLEKVNG